MPENYITQLREILEAATLSQAQLAKRLGVTFAALNRWLHGAARPHPRRIVAIGKRHRELVSYPSLTPDRLRELVRSAESLKVKGLWAWITRHAPLQDDLLLEHTYNSTSIEGTTFTKRQTEVVIFDRGLIPDKSLKEHLEVTNHAAVLRSIFQRRYREPISEGLIRRLHRDLMQGIREDAGEYSRHHRAIRGVNIALTHPKDIPEEMGRLIREWRSRPKKTIREIAVFHAHFELVHPFGDGNGRVGRLLIVIQCLERDYPPVVIENARKAEYYEVLEYAQRRSEGPLVQFLLEEMRRTGHLLKKHRVA